MCYRPAMDGNTGVIEPPLEEKRFTAEDFLAMVEAGVFATTEGKVELADGRVVVAPVDGARHISVAHRLNMLWTPRLAAAVDLRARAAFYAPGTVRLHSGSVREPDGLLCPPGIFESGRWPDAGEVFLCVEHSDTTLANDDGPKRGDYARSGLRELWIVRIERQDVRVCRDPKPDGSWATADLHPLDAVIAPLAAPELMLRVRELFE